MRKNVFVDGYERANIVEDCKNFFKRLEELKSYIIEFEKDNTIKPNIYLINCAIKGDE